MKTVSKMLAIVAIVATSTMGLQAQSSDNNMNVNANYKHQFPTSKGNKFKDSFKNDAAEDVSVHNYKQQAGNKKKRSSVVLSNFSTTSKTTTVNSKHPYGL